jgi:ubiquitin
MNLLNLKNRQSKKTEEEKKLKERCIQYALQTKPMSKADDVCDYAEQYYKYISLEKNL